MKKLLVGEITNTIYLSDVKDLSNGNYEMMGVKKILLMKPLCGVWMVYKKLQINELNNTFEVRYKVCSCFKDDERR